LRRSRGAIAVLGRRGRRRWRPVAIRSLGRGTGIFPIRWRRRGWRRRS